MDEERAHNLVINALKVAQNIPWVLDQIQNRFGIDLSPDPVVLCGIKFPNRIGLAAGFDKNAKVVLALEAMGFGSVEVGTVLPEWQQGNPRPRVFRFDDDHVIINRMGFNSAGALRVRAHLEKYRSRVKIPIGISVSKMRDTPPEKAGDDCAAALTLLYDLGDYFVINASSPNTVGLRLLQNPRQLEQLTRGVVDTATRLAKVAALGTKPVFVKIDPDFEDAQLPDVLSAIKNGGASGVIATNTTTRMPPRIRDQHESLHGAGGGLSGDPLFPKALHRVEHIRKIDPTIPLIGVGGVRNERSVVAMREAGADIIQIYTGFIYEGPWLVRALREYLYGIRNTQLVSASG